MSSKKRKSAPKNTKSAELHNAKKSRVSTQSELPLPAVASNQRNTRASNKRVNEDATPLPNQERAPSLQESQQQSPQIIDKVAMGIRKNDSRPARARRDVQDPARARLEDYVQASASPEEGEPARVRCEAQEPARARQNNQRRQNATLEDGEPARARRDAQDPARVRQEDHARVSASLKEGGQARERRDVQVPARARRDDHALASATLKEGGPARAQRDDQELTRVRRDVCARASAPQENEALMRVRQSADTPASPWHGLRVTDEQVIHAAIQPDDFEIDYAAEVFEPRAASSGVNIESSISRPLPSTSAAITVSGQNTSDVHASTDDPIARLANTLHATLVNFRETSFNENNSRLVNRLTSAKSLPSFSGDAFEWLHFKESYEMTSELGGYSDRENVARLFSALRGEARDTVSTMLATNQDARSIMNVLELHYGNKKLLAHRIVNEMKNLPDIESGKIKLTLFASKLKSAVNALRSYNLIGYLYSPELIKCIGNKLPSALKYSYNNYAYSASNENSDLEKLADFLFREAERSVRGGIFDDDLDVTSKRSVTDRRQLTSYRPARVHATSHREAAELPSVSQTALCVICSRDNHTAANCSIFARDSYERRWFLVNKYKLCYKCLNAGHSKNDCRSQNCAQCSRPHHALLHNTNRSRFENKGIVKIRNNESNNDVINTRVSNKQSKSS